MIFILFMRTHISWKTALNVSSEETSLLNTARKSPLPDQYDGDKLKDCFCKLFMATTQLQLRRWPKYRFSFADCWRGQASTSSTPAPRLGSQHCNDCMITHCAHCNQSHSPPSQLKHFFEPTESRSSLTKAMHDDHYKPTYCWSWVLNPWQLPLWTGFEGTQEASEPEISHLLR